MSDQKVAFPTDAVHAVCLAQDRDGKLSIDTIGDHNKIMTMLIEAYIAYHTNVMVVSLVNMLGAGPDPRDGDEGPKSKIVTPGAPK